MTRLPRFTIIWASLWLLASAALGASPDVEYLFPAGGQRGTTITITAGNKAESTIAPWPAKVWIDCEGVAFTAGKKPGTFEVKIADDAPPGPHLLRIYNDDGSSLPRVFVVGTQPEILEKKPNDDLKSAQVVRPLPAVVNGTLDKPGDVDFYAVDVPADTWLMAELDCRRLGAPCDPALRLVDESGVVVAFNHDTFGLDPLIAFKPPHAGRYIIQVIGFPYPPGSEVRFVGSKAIVYRLNLTSGPYARIAFPACVPRDRKSEVRPLGWNIIANSPPFSEMLTLDIDPAHLRIFNDQAIVSSPALGNILRLALADIATATEQEPNNTPDHAQSVTLPAGIDGRLNPAGDVDCFAFDATAKEHYTVIVRANSLNSPVDPMVVISDLSGKELSRDVGAGQDIRLEWTATATGRFVVSVSDMKRAGGGEYVYHLEIDRSRPDFTARVDAPNYRLQVGKTAKVQVTITKLGGHSQPLTVEAVDLPEGVTAAAQDVPAKGGAVTLTLSAATGAKPANQLLHIVVRADGKAPPRAATYEPAAGDLNVPCDMLWLSVASNAEPVKKKKK